MLDVILNQCQLFEPTVQAGDFFFYKAVIESVKFLEIAANDPYKRF